MQKKFLILIFTVIILAVISWLVVQLELLNKRIGSLDAKIDKATGETEEAEGADRGTGKTGYELTIDMWKVFEQELQDYKQRVKEGKQFYAEQQTGWNSILTELKKSLQEYDKFVTAEGEFWEKQLKNYDKLLARTEERFDILGQVIEELRSSITELETIKPAQEEGISIKEKEKVIEAGREEGAQDIQRISPQIKGVGEYKTYPSKEEKKESGKQGKESKTGEIRGTVTGTGEYKTY